MVLVARALAAIIVVAIAAFCVFGFMATYEPLDPGAQITWRIIYGAIGGICAVAAVWSCYRAEKVREADSRRRASALGP
jgi:hypothetical protein